MTYTAGEYDHNCYYPDGKCHCFEEPTITSNQPDQQEESEFLQGFKHGYTLAKTKQEVTDFDRKHVKKLVKPPTEECKCLCHGERVEVQPEVCEHCKPTEEYKKPFPKPLIHKTIDNLAKPPTEKNVVARWKLPPNKQGWVDITDDVEITVKNKPPTRLEDIKKGQKKTSVSALGSTTHSDINFLLSKIDELEEALAKLDE